MSKDPAFLFYSSNFLSGTMFFTDDQVGKYIRLLCAQHQNGRMTEKQVLSICKTKDPDIFSKLVFKDGVYFNEKLEEVMEKRLNFTESRRNNGLKGGRPTKKHKPSAKPSANLHINTNTNTNIIAHLNKITGKKFRPDSVETIKNINARLKENYSEDDFKTVIEKKAQEWTGTEYERYLTPDTLFGKKFDKYLNQSGNLIKPKEPPKSFARQDADDLDDVLKNLKLNSLREVKTNVGLGEGKLISNGNYKNVSSL